MFPPDERGKAGAHTESAAFHSDAAIPARIEGFKKDVIVALAGPIANVKYSGSSKSFRVGAADDIERAKDDANIIALLEAGHDLPHPILETFNIKVDSSDLEHANDLFETMKAEAELLVTRFWPTIERVAEALMTRDLITEAELDSLIDARAF
jgi:hypothetical protein